MYELSVCLIGSSWNVNNLVWKHILYPWTFIQCFISKAQFYFPYRLLIVWKSCFTSKGKTIVVKVLIGFFVFSDVIIKLFFIFIINLIRIKKLRLFPVPKLNHHLRLLSSKDQSWQTMNYLKLIIFNLLNLEDLTDIVFINVSKLGMLITVIVWFCVEKCFIVLFIDEHKVMVTHNMGKFDLRLN